ncbi:MAG: ATP-dependent Clp protease proteolytic subunit, partial [Chloroflexi bacterium]|nr:ATP-dependent Clp protease proteolytic subunit [Chloroflexota bacterium]
MHWQRRWIAWLLAAALLLGARPQAQAQSEALVLVLEAKGALTPAMAEYLDRGLRLAETRQAEALVLQLDTPGGSIDLMNRMVQSIRGSQVPVIVFVAPRGAIAGSAGTILVLAGHAAAMAPETAIGAASPVGSQGEDLGETMEAKEKEILKAEARGLAERRGEAATALAEAA